MAEENKDQDELEWSRFRSMIIAYHLGDAKKILDVLDPKNGEEEGQFAEELTDEEMESYEPYSVEEAQAAIEALKKFGVAIQ